MTSSSSAPAIVVTLPKYICDLFIPAYGNNKTAFKRKIRICAYWIGSSCDNFVSFVFKAIAIKLTLKQMLCTHLCNILFFITFLRGSARNSGCPSNRSRGKKTGVIWTLFKRNQHAFFNHISNVSYFDMICLCGHVSIAGAVEWRHVVVMVTYSCVQCHRVQCVVLSLQQVSELVSCAACSFLTVQSILSSAWWHSMWCDHV